MKENKILEMVIIPPNPPIKTILIGDELPLNNKIGNIVESLNILPKILITLERNKNEIFNNGK